MLLFSNTHRGMICVWKRKSPPPFRRRNLPFGKRRRNEGKGTERKRNPWGKNRVKQYFSSNRAASLSVEEDGGKDLAGGKRTAKMNQRSKRLLLMMMRMLMTVMMAGREVSLCVYVLWAWKWRANPNTAIAREKGGRSLKVLRQRKKGHHNWTNGSLGLTDWLPYSTSSHPVIQI